MAVANEGEESGEIRQGESSTGQDRAAQDRSGQGRGGGQRVVHAACSLFLPAALAWPADRGGVVVGSERSKAHTRTDEPLPRAPPRLARSPKEANMGDDNARARCIERTEGRWNKPPSHWHAGAVPFLAATWREAAVGFASRPRGDAALHAH